MERRPPVTIWSEPHVWVAQEGAEPIAHEFLAGFRGVASMHERGDSSFLR